MEKRLLELGHKHLVLLCSDRIIGIKNDCIPRTSVELKDKQENVEVDELW